MALMYCLDLPFSYDRHVVPARSYDPFRALWHLDRAAAQLMNANTVGNSVDEVQNDKEKFAVKLNCCNFRPDELAVNVKGKELIVEGHHEEKSDLHGRVERHFIRKFALTKDVNVEALQCHLTESGHLSVVAPKVAIEAGIRQIPIQSSTKPLTNDADTVDNSAGSK